MKNTSFAPAYVWLGCSLFALSSFIAVAADLYKCAGDGGIPVYQNAPCEKGKELRNLSNEDTLSVVPMRVEPSRLPPPPPSTPPLPPPAVTPPATVPATNAPSPGSAPPAAKEAPPASDGAPQISSPVSAPPPAGLPEITPLGAAALARMSIKPGMTTAEVEAKLGPAPMTTSNDAPDQPIRWFYFPTEGDNETITTIVFQRGKVTNVDRKPTKKD